MRARQMSLPRVRFFFATLCQARPPSGRFRKANNARIATTTTRPATSGRRICANRDSTSGTTNAPSSARGYTATPVSDAMAAREASLTRARSVITPSILDSLVRLPSASNVESNPPAVPATMRLPSLLIRRQELAPPGRCPRQHFRYRHRADRGFPDRHLQQYSAPLALTASPRTL